MYILFIGRIVSAMGSLVWSMMTLILSGKLNFTPTMIATVTIILSALSIPVSLLGGFLSDRFSRKKLIIICDLFSVGLYYLIGVREFAISSLFLFAAAALFQSAEDPAYTSLVADLSSADNREKAYSLTYLGTNLGMVLSPTLGGILYKNHLGLLFIINGSSILISTILILFFIKDVKGNNEGNIYEKEIGEASILPYLKAHKTIFLYIAACFIYEGVYGMYGYLLPLELERQYLDLGSIIYGTMSSLNCLVVIIFTSLITRYFFKTRDTIKQLLGTSLVVLGLFVFMTFIDLPFMPYVAIIIFTWGEIFSAISSRPYITRRIPANYRGRLISVISIATMTGSSCSIFLTGRIYDSFGSLMAWVYVMGLGLIGIIINLLVIRLDKTEYLNLYK